MPEWLRHTLVLSGMAATAVLIYIAF